MKASEGLQFLRQFQELLSEGGFVATYKFALLQALADLSVEQPIRLDGSLPIPIEQIAEKFIEYYWHQARPFREEVLKQNTKGQAEIVQIVQDFRDASGGNLARARTQHKEWAARRTKVGSTIIKMPLWKLQTFGNTQNEFLYRKSEYADRTIRLLPGVPLAFRSFHPLLTSMIRGAWIEHIMRIRDNQELIGPQAQLGEFLFGIDRATLDGYRDVLRHHQSAECFYCGGKVSDTGDLDHFIPWSRYPVDLGHGFVFAHKGCNNSKRDHLAGVDHLRRWREQNLDEGQALAREFRSASLRHDLDRSLLIARWAYQQGEVSRAQLWIQNKVFEPCDYRWQMALGTPTGVSLAADEGPQSFE